MTRRTAPSRARMALCMAFYTFLLALGAALPVLASYGDAFEARGARPVEGGGRPQAPRADDATDDARAPLAAPTGRARALGLSVSDRAPTPLLPAPAAPASADARGS